jgi:hypothetical protein
MTKCSGGGGTGQEYSYAQLEGLWINAGGPKKLAPVMAAIAMAESGGCSAALNSIGACGLWQIHPRQAGCLDAATNARQAVAKYQGQGLGAWTTYTSGRYKKFLSDSTTPDLTAGGSPAPAASSGGDCLVGIPALDLKVTSIGGGCAISYGEARAVLGGALIAGGGLIMLLGAAILAAYGLKSAGAGKAAGSILEAGGAAVALVPGAEAAGIAANRAGSAVRSQGARRGAQGEAVRRARGTVAAQKKAAREKAAADKAAARKAARKPAPAGESA